MHLVGLKSLNASALSWPDYKQLQAVGAIRLSQLQAIASNYALNRAHNAHSVHVVHTRVEAKMRPEVTGNHAEKRKYPACVAL